jgi:hypothetical protein
LNSTGRGVLARSHDNGATFVDAVSMPRGFVYATAANAVLPLEASLSGTRRFGVFVFGIPRYRASVSISRLCAAGQHGRSLGVALFGSSIRRRDVVDVV